MMIGNAPDSQQMLLRLQKLEARVTALERALEVSSSALRLRLGTSLLQLTPNSVTLQGDQVTMSSSGKINIKASGDLVLKGSKIVEN